MEEQRHSNGGVPATSVIVALVALHLGVAVWHGRAHTVLAVALSPWQNAFVIGVILIAPLVAAPLLWTRYARVGAWTFVLSMLGALLFGVYYHFVFVSPDHIGHLPQGSVDAQKAFVDSASVLAVLELTSTVYGAVYLRSLRRESSRRPS